MPIDDKDIYREIGENFRLTLRWREGLLAGFLVLTATLSIASYKLYVADSLKTTINLSGLAWVPLFVGAVLAFMFLFLDRRCHDVLKDSYRLGARLEKDAGKDGSYAASVERGLHPKHITHKTVLELLYTLTGIGLLVMALYLLMGIPVGVNSKGGTAMSDFGRAAFFVGFYWLVKLVPGLVLSYLGYRLLSIDLPEKQENTQGSQVGRIFWLRSIAGGLIAAVGIMMVISFVWWGLDLEHVKGLGPSSSQAIPKSLAK